ncbi:MULTISPECIES: hypothetical protein [unclassified Pseudomonas]|uniref:hypothetical protein n=1 Tax=unclassified Pseudomonas TaxID=196821 RepID=UPI0015A051AA|nr:MULTISPECIES: hypothetical protein [unclassified Pseudomonas]NWC92617.1 hypothetical protein [Pseudomonas sp. IPO3779]NWD15614.1 hypothetical protein [Pseudomonas sp. IPO3778]
MKTCLLAALLMSASYSGFSAADDLYMERKGAPAVTTCNNADALATVAEIRQNNMTSRVDELREIELTSKCYTGMMGDASYTILDIQKITKNGKTYNITHISRTTMKSDRYILSEDLTPYVDPTKFTLDTSCNPNSIGGQVNRMEADKDGRLYLKKYMVTSKCVNGKNTAVWKPLN